MVDLKSRKTDDFDRIYERMKARQKQIDASRAFNRPTIINIPLTPPINVTPRDNMAYEIVFSSRRLAAIFGTAYPSLTLSDGQKLAFIREAIGSIHGLKTGYGSEFSVDRSKSRSLWDRDTYEFTINSEGGKRRGYEHAVAIEKYLYGIKRLGLLSPPRFWNKWFRSKRPTDTFLINDLDYGKVFAWLQENVQYSDYQLYSKFGQDISLGFRNPEYATMFKLTFGDQTV